MYQQHGYGSPLFPVIADFVTEDFKKVAFDQATHKPLCWFHYANNMDVIWPMVQTGWVVSPNI
jgi:hypothetical protein